MNNITQVKRGTTASWSLGPELVHWEELDVWGKDSIIHCEGTDLEMNVYTSSANYFYDENRQLEDVKRPGLWLIKNNEIDWNMADQVVFKCHVEGPSDCWLEVYSSRVPAIHGQKIYLNAGTVEMTVPYLGEWGIYMRWPEERETPAIARVKMSIRVKDAYEELVPGQLGVEYTEDGKVKLKAGMPGLNKWNELPYIGETNPLIVTFQGIEEDIVDEDTGFILTKLTDFQATHTPEECKQALLQGRNVFVYGDSNTSAFFGQAYYISGGEGVDAYSTVLIICTGIDYGNPLSKHFMIRDQGNTWDYQAAYIQTLLPFGLLVPINNMLTGFDNRNSAHEQQLNIQ